MAEKEKANPTDLRVEKVVKNPYAKLKQSTLFGKPFVTVEADEMIAGSNVSIAHKEETIPPCNEGTMGIQSQARGGQREKKNKPNYQQHHAVKKRAGKQSTLNGEAAFDSEKDCKACIFKAKGESHKYHKGHDKRCRHSKYYGKCQETVNKEKWERDVAKANSTPVVFNQRPTNKQALDFIFGKSIKAKAKKPGTPQPEDEELTATESESDGETPTVIKVVPPRETTEADKVDAELFSAVQDFMKDDGFIKAYQDVPKNAPLPMLALAKHVTRDINKDKKNLPKWFKYHDVTLTVPVHRAEGSTWTPTTTCWRDSNC